MGKTPRGIAVYVTLLTLGSIWNLVLGLDFIRQDLGFLPYLSVVHGTMYYRYAVPADIVICVCAVLLALLDLFAAYGLYKARTWSYVVILIASLMGVAVYVAHALLYALAPSELSWARIDVVAPRIVVSAISVVWAVVTWSYITRQNVKQYLKRIPQSALMSPEGEEYRI